MSDFKTPRELWKAYRAGLPGATCDYKELDELLAQLSKPLFGVSAHELAGDGAGKLSLPFKSLLKFDPGFGPAERQETGDCHFGSTIVVSDHCKAIKDIIVGDKIYSMDGSFTTVISTQIKISNNPIVKIKTKGSIPLKVTSDHQVMIGRKESVTEGETIVKTITRKWTSAQDIKKGDYVITPINLQVTDKPINEFTLHEDFDWFLGYFLGDGWCDKKQLEITFAEHQTDFFDRCSDFLLSFGFNVKRCDYNGKNTSAFRLRCWCPKLSTFLRNAGYDNKNKMFPLWSIGNEDTVRGLVDSDGFIKEKKEVFDSKSTSLAYGVYYTYLKLGYKPTINYFYRSKKGAYKDSQSYRVTCIYNKKKNYSFIKNDELYIQVSDIELTEGPHEVYDIGVDDKSHAFLANGVISHNCVSHGQRNAIDVTRAVEIDIKREPEDFVTRSATEAIYGSRGHGGQGMTCSGAAKFVNQLGGILLRKNYPDIGVDFSKYNANLGAGWGSRGVPEAVKKEGQKHQVKTISLITTAEEARDAIANGYAINVCSSQGFSSKRDKNGFASPSGSWAHAMAWVGCDDTQDVYRETCFLVQNSWGIWNSGPKTHGQPEGSFWIREGVAQKMLNARGAWVTSNVDGFPPRKLPDYGTSDYL